jgi:hypothetical protein
MASSIVTALGRIKHRLEHFAPAHAIERHCRDVGHRWRRRTLGPATTVQLTLLQILSGCALTGLRRVASEVRATAQAVAKARARLPVTLWSAVLAMLRPAATSSSSASSSSCGASLWHGLRVWVADGMSFLTADTPALAGRYGKPSNRFGKARGYPAPKLLSLLDLATGAIARCIPLPYERQEQTCLSRLFAMLAPGDLLVGDRGLGSFAQLALLITRGVAGVFRLPKDRVVKGRGKGNRRRVRRLGPRDNLVTWDRTGARPSWMSKLRLAALPASLVLRQVAFRIRRRGRRDRWCWLVTTLTDPIRYPAKDLVALYRRRWRVEVCFRDLKRSLAASSAGPRRRVLVAARTPEGVRKELLALVVLYNLVRALMAGSAARQGVAAERVSFVDALRCLLWCDPAADAEAELIVNPARRRPTEPRRVKGGGKAYPLLNRGRASLQMPAGEAVI